MHRIPKRRAVVTAVILTVLLPTIQKLAFADTETPRVVLGPGANDLVVGPGMNAAGRDLRGCEFVGQDLTGANFDGCNLYDVRLEDCILKCVSFRGAVFTGARVGIGPYDLEGADFTDATVNEVQHPSLGGFLPLRLSPQQLVSTRSYKTKDLHQCAINGSWDRFSFDFRGADLRHARLAGGDFTECAFSGAHIYGVKFRGVTVAFEQLASTADFRRGRLCVEIGAAVRNSPGLTGKCDFSGIDLRGSSLGAMKPDTDFTDTIINECTIVRGLTKTQLYSTRSYQEGNLTRVSWALIDLSGFDLARMNLTGTSFGQCDFTEASFEDAVITGVNFVSVPSFSWGCKGLTLEQIKSTWNCKHGHMEGIILPEELAKALKQEQEGDP